MIKPITVVLINKSEAGKDGFGHPIYSEKRVNIDNVLVAPIAVQDLPNNFDFTGKKAVYQIAIPKGDTHVWKDQKVEFFGEVWQVVGFPKRGIDENIPLKWNDIWMVELYE